MKSTDHLARLDWQTKVELEADAYFDAQPESRVMDKPAKKRGRPATGHRPSFTFRMSPFIRERIAKAAAKWGVSLSEEVERRLNQSFDVDALAAMQAEISDMRKELRDCLEKLATARNPS